MKRTFFSVRTAAAVFWGLAVTTPATADEAEELDEEGIEFFRLPQSIRRNDS